MNKQKLHESGVINLSQRISAARREACRTSIIKFGQNYLSHLYSKPPAGFHRELTAALEKAAVERGFQGAAACPRSHAKSTTMQTGVLWSICYGTEQFVVVIADTVGQAEDYISFLKRELTENELLRSDFPQVCETGGKPGPPRWRRNEIVTRNGVRVLAFGARQKIRGRRHQQYRPTMIILDDCENDEAVRSEEQRAQLLDWFEKVVLKAGSQKTTIMIVGTILHSESLLATLLKRPGWWSRKYAAIVRWPDDMDFWQIWENNYTGREAEEDEVVGPKSALALFNRYQKRMLAGSEVLWPEQMDLYALMVMRVAASRASFASEMQNAPIDSVESIFTEGDIHYWDNEQTEKQLLDSLRGHVQIFGACDPSLGKAGRRNDDSAIITIARDTKSGALYVLDADIRRRTPDQVIKTILQYCRYRKYSSFAIESNQYQEFLADEVKRRGDAQAVYTRIQKVNHTTDKVMRLQGLQPLMTTGTIKFSRRHTLLLDQLRQFPNGAHDDGPDALEMAVSIAGKGKRQLTHAEIAAGFPKFGWQLEKQDPFCMPYGPQPRAPGRW